MPRKSGPSTTLADRQADLDATKAHDNLKKYLQTQGLSVNRLSIVAIGQRFPTDAPVEMAYQIHIDSDQQVNGLTGTILGTDGKTRFTFVQAGPSVLTNSFRVVIAASYNGNDPPDIPPP